MPHTLHFRRLQFGTGGLNDTTIPTMAHAANIPRPPATAGWNQRSSSAPAAGDAHPTANTGHTSESHFHTEAVTLITVRLAGCEFQGGYYQRQDDPRNSRTHPLSRRPQ